MAEQGASFGGQEGGGFDHGKGGKAGRAQLVPPPRGIQPKWNFEPETGLHVGIQRHEEHPLQCRGIDRVDAPQEGEMVRPAGLGGRREHEVRKRARKVLHALRQPVGLRELAAEGKGERETRQLLARLQQRRLHARGRGVLVLLRRPDGLPHPTTRGEELPAARVAGNDSLSDDLLGPRGDRRHRGLRRRVGRHSQSCPRTEREGSEGHNRGGGTSRRVPETLKRPRGLRGYAAPRSGGCKARCRRLTMRSSTIPRNWPW
ncbi:hypothetical protein DFJ74DRAFT_686759 [Hyaloraphidium curvatum]|nr:hypothetical protein DFJ74DRAFT_686759 [Hyaloraphidium curvatum]